MFRYNKFNKIVYGLKSTSISTPLVHESFCLWFLIAVLGDVASNLVRNRRPKAGRSK